MTGVGRGPTRPLTVAVTGARCEVRVDGRAVAFGEPVSLRAGAVVTVGPARHGRAVLPRGALAGSTCRRSSARGRRDTLAGVGPPPLPRGRRAAARRRAPASPRPLDVAPRPAGRGPLRLLPGTAGGLVRRDGPGAALTRATYVVAPDSNRVGLRLARTRLERRRTDELRQRGHRARRGAGAARRAAGGAPARPPGDRRLPGDRGRRSPTTCPAARSCGRGTTVRFSSRRG